MGRVRSQRQKRAGPKGTVDWLESWADHPRGYKIDFRIPVEPHTVAFLSLRQIDTLISGQACNHLRAVDKDSVNKWRLGF
jgi:hypothetical protein